MFNAVSDNPWAEEGASGTQNVWGDGVMMGREDTKAGSDGEVGENVKSVGGDDVRGGHDSTGGRESTGEHDITSDHDITIDHDSTRDRSINEDSQPDADMASQTSDSTFGSFESEQNEPKEPNLALHLDLAALADAMYPTATFCESDLVPDSMLTSRKGVLKIYGTITSSERQWGRERTPVGNFRLRSYLGGTAVHQGLARIARDWNLAERNLEQDHVGGDQTNIFGWSTTSGNESEEIVRKRAAESQEAAEARRRRQINRRLLECAARETRRIVEQAQQTQRVQQQRLEQERLRREVRRQEQARQKQEAARRYAPGSPSSDTRSGRGFFRGLFGKGKSKIASDHLGSESPVMEKGAVANDLWTEELGKVTGAAENDDDDDDDEDDFEQNAYNELGDPSDPDPDSDPDSGLSDFEDFVPSTAPQKSST